MSGGICRTREISFSVFQNRGDGTRPFAQILVRVDGFGERYRFVSENYNPSEPLLGPGQLQELADLSTGENATRYLDAANRIAAWASENTGDIVLLANMDGGFYLDGGDLTSTHGSLSARDGLVPLAFAYPGATSKVEGEDTLLAKVRAFLQAGTGGPAAAFKIPTEANSARCFLGLIPCQ